MRSEMQVGRTRDKVDKAKQTITSVKKSASCSHGWLRLVVQCIFGAITITSFVLIVYMSMTTNSSQNSTNCQLNGCRVVCTGISFFSNNDNDIVNAIREAETNCEQVTLILQNTFFFNSTVPDLWLSNLRSNVNELRIVGGNLKYINSQAFMTQFASNIHILHLEGITISIWGSEALVGLINLKEIVIKNSHILEINKNALEAVDNTLNTLSITESGFWNPTNLTGYSNLEVLTSVFLSQNNFNNILNKDSFKNLQRCKTLYLNSCRINAIGEGTFDYLDEIEMLFLNNNFLIILPNGLFSKIMAISNPRPRINLQDNLWYCDCSVLDLFHLTSSGVLDVDPLCYYPALVRGRTFSSFVQQCQSDTKTTSVIDRSLSNLDAILMERTCSSNRGVATLISSISFLTCSSAQLGTVLMSNVNTMPMPHNSTKKSHSNRLLKTKFAVQSDSLSMLEITSAGSPAGGNYGLLWYQTECPNELYCVNTLPNYLRIYNIVSDVEYTFCPIILSTGKIDSELCIFHSLQTTDAETTIAKTLRILSYIFTTIICTTVGAGIVYTAIRKFPYLLKGSDRILFVKHKNVDALILPPKVPLRENSTKDHPAREGNNVIFTLTDNTVMHNPFVRTKSTRSSKSLAPSYISAMQPTEEQLTEWRLRHHFDNLTITSGGFDVPYSLLVDKESLYCSLDQTNSGNYESLK